MPVKVQLRVVDLKLRHPWAVSSNALAGGKRVAPTVFVELSDDAGRRGIGESPTTNRYAETVESIGAFHRLLDPQRLSFDDLPGSLAYLEALAPGHQSAKAAIEVALLDAISRAQDRPLCDFLGLGFVEGKHLTTLSIGIDTPDMIRVKVREAAAFPKLKVKVGDTNDDPILAALRSEAPDKLVRVDANEAWKTREEALRHIERLARDDRIELIEQPMPDRTDSRDLRWLKERSPLPVFADESCRGARDVDRCAECFHGVNVKLAKSGGITGAMAVLRAARQAGLQTMIGCMVESSVLVTAAAHLAELADHLDIDGNLLITNDPYVGVSSAGGRISFAHAPDAAGLRVRPRPGSGLA